jgi:hypothetical protein
MGFGLRLMCSGSKFEIQNRAVVIGSNSIQGPRVLIRAEMQAWQAPQQRCLPHVRLGFRLGEAGLEPVPLPNQYLRCLRYCRNGLGMAHACSKSESYIVGDVCEMKEIG